MKVSVELTLSPLQDGFREPVIHFIKKLREYDRVMEVLTQEVKEVFDLIESGLIYIKIVKSDRHNYEPYF